MQNAQFLVDFLADNDEKPVKKPKEVKTLFKSEIERKVKPNKSKNKGEQNKASKITNNKIKDTQTNLLDINNSDNLHMVDFKIDTEKILPMKEWAEENYYGKTEYKLKLINKSKERIQGLITQMKFRLREGNGTCFYEIGLEDNGNPLGLNEDELKQSIDTLYLMTQEIGAQMDIMNFFEGKEGLIAEVMITQSNSSDSKISLELRIGLIGEEGAGKSTLVGCLISDKKDNGKGLTRVNVFRHKHEIICGKTSSITHQIVGLDEKGKVTNTNQYGAMNDWAQICEKSVKIINFFDMGGSEKSLKNTVKTLSKNYLDYIFFFISADKGISNMTSDYLKIALSLGLPIVTIITKVDLINEDDLADLLNNFKCILKAQKKGKNPLLVQDKNDIVTFSRNITEGILPVFLISNKKGIGLDLFINFLNLMPDSTSQNNFENLSLNEKETLFDVLEIIIVENKLILLGIVTKGVIVKDCVYKLGPDSNGNFKTVQVKSIHCKKVDVKSAFQGQFCSVCLDESLTKDSVRTGMVILSSSSTSAACRRFEAEIWSIAGQGKKIKLSAQPLIHVPPIRQTVKIFKDKSWENSSSEDLEVFEDKTIKIFFEFMYAPEYIREGSHLIIYENNFKIYGYVTKIIN